MQLVSSPPPGGFDNVDAGSESLSGSFAGLALGAASADAPAGQDDSSSALPTLTVVPMMGGGITNPALIATEDKQQQQSSASSGGRRLFFSQASPDASEVAVQAVFGAHGTVEAVQLFSDAGGSSGCCGYVTMASHEAARAALTALQQAAAAGAVPAALPGLSVSWALAEPCRSPAGTPDGTSASSNAGAGSLSSLAANAGRTVFFAKVPPTALASEVESLFGSFGKLAEVNVFRAWAGAKHSKGCGLITYVERDSAASAIGQLHGKYVFPGSDCPMVVEWMDLKKQRPVAPPSSAEKPPLGCSSGAYKLLLGNVPAHVTEGDMAILLSQFGRVVHISLSPNVSSGALGLTCSGHVWFATKQSADALLERVKAEPLWLRDHRSGQDVALVVKKARRAGSSASSSGGGGGGAATSLARLPVIGASSAVTMSSSSNSSSSNLMPSLQLAGAEFGGALAALQASGRVAATHPAIDASMLSPDIIRLLPLQPMMGLGSSGGSGQLQQHCGGPSAAAHGGYMAVDMCEAMLDMFDTTGMGMMAMPVHLQPAMAAQMAHHVTLQQQQQQHSLVGSACGLPGSGASMMQSCSGGHALPSATAPMGSAREELEGSFSVTLKHGMHGGLSAGARTASGLQAAAAQLLGLAPQQQVAQPAVSGLLWSQQAASQPQQAAQLLMMPHGGGNVAPQAPQSAAAAAAASGGGFKSIVVPVEQYEVQLIAGHLAFLSASSGAQVTITCLPAGGLAVMVSGRADQVAAAQSLLAAARTRC